MTITIDIPENELDEAMRFLNAKSKREAVVTALREFNQRRRMASLIRFSGTCDSVDNTTLEQTEMSETWHVGSDQTAQA